jgi:hypothetical protein
MTFLHRSICGMVLLDWQRFSPFIVEAREKYQNPNVYVEFEGLATAWQNRRSYRTGARLRQVRRRIAVT